MSEQAVIRTNPKFKPLFERIHGKHEQVEYVIITGGRESSKTFTFGVACTDAIVNAAHRVLFTRYTMTSAEHSVIPAFLNRSKLLGYDPWLTKTKKSVECTHNKGRVDFKGFKTGAGNQTAALKSLEDYSMLVLEEAEEYPNYKEFEKVDLSLRSSDLSPFTVLILNSASKNHWIYKEFFEKKGVKGGHNGIVGNVLYIHVTYLDLGKKYVTPKNWRKFESARLVYEEIQALRPEDRKRSNKEKLKTWTWYKEVVLGEWRTAVEGVIFEDWEMFTEYPMQEINGKMVEIEPDLHTFGLDFGYSNDPTSLIELRRYGNKRYYREHIYETHLSNKEIAERIKISAGEDYYIFADPAEPKSIADLQSYGCNVVAALKGEGSIKAGIRKMLDGEIFVHKDSDNLKYEMDHYHQKDIPNNKGETVTIPIDKDNHAIDACRYAESHY